MNDQGSPTNDPSRRQFIRRTLQGASLFGLGSAFGLASAEQAEKVISGESRKKGNALGSEFNYDISKLAQVDPKLIQYEESAKIATGFKDVRAVAVGEEDRVYAAGDQQIRIFTKNGAPSGEISLSGVPRALALAVGGSIYVGLTKYIEIYDTSGARQARWESLGENAVITSVAVGEKDISVADAGNRIVLRYDLNGKLTGRIGKRDKARNVPGFAVPSPFFDLAIGADGLLWVANPGGHRLEAYTFAGDFETSWGEAGNVINGFCGCCNPIHFACLPGGRFVTSEKGLARVKIYSSKGDLESVVASPASFPKQMENPNVINRVCMDLAVDSAGRILLADAQTREIRIFSRKQTT